MIDETGSWSDIDTYHWPHTPNLRESIAEHQPFLLKIIDYISFPRVLGQLVMNDPQFAGVLYTEDLPVNVRPQTPCIIYRMIRRVPGMDGVATRKPRLRFWYRNEDDQTMIEVWSQWMTCIYQFDCVASTSQDADNILYKLDWFIRNNVGIFLNMGASELVFQEQLEDLTLPKTDDLIVRSIRWLARLENLEYRTTSLINQATIRVFEPKEVAIETITRNSDQNTPDELQQTFISDILIVSDPSPSGIALTNDYFPNVDYLILYNRETHKTALQWLEAGKNPAFGATYFVKYAHWTAFSRIRLPYY